MQSTASWQRLLRTSNQTEVVSLPVNRYWPTNIVAPGFTALARAEKLMGVGGLLPLVRREDDGAVGFKRDWRFAGVDHLQLRADGVKHDLQDKEPATSYIRE